jgi:hypothetical protein
MKMEACRKFVFSDDSNWVAQAPAASRAPGHLIFVADIFTIPEMGCLQHSLNPKFWPASGKFTAVAYVQYFGPNSGGKLKQTDDAGTRLLRQQAL